MQWTELDTYKDIKRLAQGRCLCRACTAACQKKTTVGSDNDEAMLKKSWAIYSIITKLIAKRFSQSTQKQHLIHHHHHQFNTHECSMNNKIHEKAHTIIQNDTKKIQKDG